MSTEPAASPEDEWLFGWDSTPAIVSVWADADGRAFVWRRTPDGLVRDDLRFRPWILERALARRLAPLAPPYALWASRDGAALACSLADARPLDRALLQRATR